MMPPTVPPRGPAQPAQAQRRRATSFRNRLVNAPRRLNNLPVYLGATAVVAVLGAVVYGVSLSDAPVGGVNATVQPRFPANPQKVIATAPPTITVPDGLTQPAVFAPDMPPTPPVNAQPVEIDPEMTPEAIERRRQAWENYETQLAQRRQQQQQALAQALSADPAAGSSSPGQQNGPGQNGLPDLSGLMASMPGPAQMPAQMVAAGAPAPATTPQQHRRDFAFGAGASDNPYLEHTLTPPISPYEIKAGTPVCGRLITGINTDSPGIIKATVTRNVHDYATGTHVLIPQGATLLGVQDTAVAYGQETVITAWNRVIYPAPGGESLNLGAMPGSDTEGYAGFRDQTDHHTWQVFKNAILLSLFSSGVQLSQPQSRGDYYNPGQTVGSALGQQLGQLGQEFARRGLDIPPTNKVRNGYPFCILTTKDIAFARPWTPSPAPQPMQILGYGGGL